MSSKRFKAIIAVYIILRKNDELLLLKRHNTDFCNGMYSFIAGHVDGQENLYKAAIREAKEEGGVEIKQEDLKFVHVMHRKALHIGEHDEILDFFFVCDKWKNDFYNAEPHKCSELKFFSIDNLPDNIIDYVAEVITKISNNNNNQCSIWGW